ncbi:MAG: SDR family oxidoreductase [Planctomycetota bacterium]|jgi:thioester reductase-like protein
MSYHILMTGATGLLGRYLLRDLLQADVQIAAVVRPSRRTSAQDRVDALMATWESMLGRELPRPKVLAGDLTAEGLGLSDEDLAWVEANCDSMLHNAASLTFVSTSSEGEPWRSNVGGTQNVLDLCRQTGIRDFHHVSTSYVAGLRSGDVLESELDVGQEFGNDYEKSKVQAETMVREADFLSPPTVYRPAIIVGDSKTGFTSTFHGFYATLNLAYTLTRAMHEMQAGEADVPTRITLDGTEKKNFVPVDWVSAVMAHILTNRQFHGDTYHLTPTDPTSTSDIKNVLEEAYGLKNAEFHGYGKEIENPTEVESLFYEHFRVYNSYWRDDPRFDSSNTQRVAPHLPCPKVDRDMLLMMARKAIEMDFKFRDAPAAAPAESSAN